jgi:hypothetical protein
MSTVGRINFEPVSDIMQVTRRDFPLADKTLADPTNALALYDGEWLALDATSKLVRASDVTTPDNLSANALVFPLFMEPGRSDVLSNAARKMAVLFMGNYEFDTRIFDAAANLGSGDPITFVGQPLKVATISLALAAGGTRAFTGLVGHGGHAADANPIVGYVTRLPAANGGKLRFVNGGRR